MAKQSPDSDCCHIRHTSSRSQGQDAHGPDLGHPVTGIFYTVKDSSYSAGIEFSDGSKHTVDFNVLNVAEAIAGITKLLADHIIDIES